MKASLATRFEAAGFNPALKRVEDVIEWARDEKGIVAQIEPHTLSGRTVFIMPILSVMPLSAK